MALTDGQMIEAAYAGKIGIFELPSFRSAMKENARVAAFAEVISKDSSIPDATQSKFITALAQKWSGNGTGNGDKDVFKKLEADLAKNPDLAQQLTAAIKNSPDTALQAIAKYDGTNMSTLLATTAPAVAPATPSVATPNTQPVTTVAGAPGVTTNPVPNAPGPNGRPLDAKPEEVPPATVAAEAVTPRPPIDPLEELSRGTDDNIRQFSSVEGVRMLAAKMGEAAVKSGVNPATATGFMKRIEKDDQLAKNISQNLQKNPDFVRQMAKMAKDNGPLVEPFKSAVTREMNKLMENPQLLADEKYVKDMQQKMKMAEDFKNSGMMSMMTQMFDGLRAQSHAFFGQMSAIGAAFSGPNPVFSMASGSGFMPSMMVNMGAYHANMGEYLAGQNYRPADMTALPTKGKDGKFTREVAILDDKGKPLTKADGTPLTQKVPNGQITLKTLDGKDVNVIPAVGALVAKEDKDGNLRVPTIQAIDDNGVATKLAFVKMTPTEFAKLQKASNEAAVAQNLQANYKTLEIDRGTVDTNTAAMRFAQEQADPIPVAKVDPASGAVTATMVQPAPQVARNTVAPVAGNRPDASNDRDMSLQA